MERDERLKQEEVLDVGGAIIDSRAALCIYSKDIDLQAISFMIGCEPTKAHRRGDGIGKRKKPAPIGLWSLDAPDGLSFEDKLKYLIKSTTSDHEIWDTLITNHDIQLRCSVFLHSWTEGFEIPADLVAEIGHRHWQFGMSIYSAEGEEILGAFLTPPQEE